MSTTWVDDAVQRMQSTGSRILYNMLEAGLAFHKAVTDEGLVIAAAKSFIIATDTDLGMKLMELFNAAECQIQYVDIAGDLGVDRGRRASGRRPKHTKRQEAGDRRATRVIRISRVARGARSLGRRLYFAGPLAQSSYPNKVHGTPPSVTTHRRRTLGKVFSSSRAPRCLTTFLQLEVGSLDPAFKGSFDLLDV